MTTFADILPKTIFKLERKAMRQYAIIQETELELNELAPIAPSNVVNGIRTRLQRQKNALAATEATLNVLRQPPKSKSNK